jgi:hypothetical protein
VAQVLEDFQALVAADHVPGPLIPYRRLDVSELLDASAQLLEFEVPGFEVFPRVVFGRFQLVNSQALDFHCLVLLSF